MAGSIRSHESLVSHIAQTVGRQTLFIEYSLAPEHPFPAGVTDVLTVYKGLLRQFPTYQVDLMGDSAGGGLAVSAISDMHRQGLPLPRRVALISPWVDLPGNTPSYEVNRANDVVLSQPYLASRASLYAGDTPLDKASPAGAPLTDFPPILIQVGSSEILLDDSRHFTQRFRRFSRSLACMSTRVSNTCGP